MTEHRITLTQHLLREVQQDQNTGAVAAIIAEIATACKEARARLAQVGLGPLAGKKGSVNVQGEAVHKLDWYANEVFVQHFSGSGLLCSMVSEELEQIHHFDEDCPLASHSLYVDPMDGSSNLDVAGVVGTIFALRPKAGDDRHDRAEQAFENGRAQEAAGYVLYGPQTMLIYAAGGAVHGFTLDTEVGEFFLSHPNIKMPTRGKEFSGNLSRLRAWDPAYHSFIDRHSHGGDGDAYSLRYIGALVGDFHRILFRGGVFFYPGDTKNVNGKLRLLYEAAPLAHLVDIAGGLATDGKQPILDIVPHELHQRTPLLIGSREEVESIHSLLA